MGVENVIQDRHHPKCWCAGHPASPVAFPQLTLHKQNLEAKFPLLQDQDGKIVEALSDPDEIEADVSDSLELLDVAHEKLLQVDCFLAELKSAQALSSQVSRSTPPPTAESDADTTRQPTLRESADTSTDVAETSSMGAATISTAPQAQQPTTETSSGQATSDVIPGLDRPPSTGLKLPKLTMPSFAGDP